MKALRRWFGKQKPPTPLTRDAVVWGFRFFLGREPGSEAAIRAHMQVGSVDELAELLLASQEFALSRRFANFLRPRSAPAATAPSVPAPFAGTPRRIMFLGNCQSRGLAQLARAMGDGRLDVTQLEITADNLAQLGDGRIDVRALLGDRDLVFVHPHGELLALLKRLCPEVEPRLRLVPAISYTGFHPDMVYIHDGKSGMVSGPFGDYQSSIAFYGWLNGLGVADTVALFAEDVYEALGFFEHAASAEKFLLGTEAMTGLALAPLLRRWSASGCWMYSLNHPRLPVLADVARALLEREGIDCLPDVERYLEDDLCHGPAWPVYPPIARRFGLSGHYQFKKTRLSPAQPVTMIGLEQMVRESFDAFARYPKEAMVCDRLASGPYKRLAGFLAQRAAAPAAAAPVAGRPAPVGGNPYLGLQDHQFWRRSIERPAMDQVDPVVRAGWTLDRSQKVATAGSCFAQHISRTLARSGFSYFVTEDGADLGPERRELGGYGVFSARFGNLYTTRQLLQLLRRAYGRFAPLDRAWLRADGRYVDPFRPYIEAEGFVSPQAVAESQEQLFAAVRRMFEQTDVLVFTMGLTESWRRKVDGAVFPLAPGVVTSAFDPADYEFVNFDVAETVADLSEFLRELRALNPAVKVILTVSPVPLIATYEDRSVLVSTVYSKSVLRVAADQMRRAFDGVDYFPSYEVITGQFNRGSYYDTDLRSVTESGVAHVMRLFMKHYADHGADAETGAGAELLAEMDRISGVVCEEERLDHDPR